MAIVKIHEAKTQLSKLIARAEGGEEIVIARGKEPVVKLEALNRPKKRRVFGALRDQFPAHSRRVFFDPLPEDELRLWEGHGDDPADPAR